MKTMESLIIHPESKKQYEVIKAFLEEMKIKFTSKNIVEAGLEDWQKELIDRGLNDFENGKIFSHEDVMKSAEEICSK